MQVHEYKSRDFIVVEDSDEIFELIKTRIASKTIYLKTHSDKIPAYISDYKSDHSLRIMTDPSFEPAGSEMTVYALLDRYIEINLIILEVMGNGTYMCRIKKMQKAANGRRFLRFKLNPDQAVSTNFRVSRQSFDLGSFTVPTSIKIVLDQFHNTNAHMSDIVKVDTFHNDDDLLIKEIKKTGKAVFIPDVSIKENYSSATEEFLDCSKIYVTDLKSVIMKNVEKGYKSIIMVPILYVDEAEKIIPFGYIQLTSKSSAFTMDNVNKVREHSIKLVERIRDANVILLPVRQEVADISRGGMRMKITNGDLKKLLPKTHGFIFDLVFKFQAPVTIYGEIRTYSSDENGNLFIGIDFQGNSSRKNEMNRFYSYLDPMEADYKAKLKKTMQKN